MKKSFPILVVFLSLPLTALAQEAVKATLKKLEADPERPGKLKIVYNCKQVREQAVRDLRAFCESAKIDNVRLVDYGFQIEILETHCGNWVEAHNLKFALNAKVHEKNERKCLEAADKL